MKTNTAMVVYRYKSGKKYALADSLTRRKIWVNPCQLGDAIELMYRIRNLESELGLISFTCRRNK